MRVAHLMLVLGMGGAERILQDLLPALRMQRVDVHMLMLHRQARYIPEFSGPLKEAGIPVHHFGIPYMQRIINRHTLSIIHTLRATLRALEPALIHTHLEFADFYGTLAAQWANRPLIITTRHNIEPFYQRPHWQVINRALWMMRDGGTAVSNTVKDYAVRFEGISSDRIVTIYNGVNAPPRGTFHRQAVRASWGMNDDSPVVGSVCRLVEIKGLNYALEAFAVVHKHIPTAQYVIVGDGPLRNELQLQAQTLGIADAVHFLGWREDSRDLLAGLDVLLAPSLREGMSVTLLEAMAAGLPIIGTAVPSTMEVIEDRVTGFLTPIGESDSLVPPLQALLGNRALARNMGMQAYTRYEKLFTVKRLADQMDTYYRIISASEHAPARKPL